MVSDASKKQAAQKKAAATAKRCGKAAAVASSKSASEISDRNCTGFVSGGEKPQPGVKTSLHHGQTRKLRRGDLPSHMLLNLVKDAYIPIKKKRSSRTKEPIPVDKGIEEASEDGKLEESYKDPGSMMDVGVKRIPYPPPQIA